MPTLFALLFDLQWSILSQLYFLSIRVPFHRVLLQIATCVPPLSLPGHLFFFLPTHNIPSWKRVHPLRRPLPDMSIILTMFFLPQWELLLSFEQ